MRVRACVRVCAEERSIQLFMLNVISSKHHVSFFVIFHIDDTIHRCYILYGLFFVVFFYFIHLLLDIFLYKSDSKNDKASRYNFIKFHYYHSTRRRACAALLSLLYAASLVRREIGWV